MPVVGRITAKFDADTKDLDLSLKGIEGAVTGTTLQVTAGFSKMEGSLAKTTSAIHAPDLADRLKGLCQLLDWLGSQLDAALQDAGTEGLLPPDDPDGAPEVGPTAAQVAARVLEEELSTNGACIDEAGRVLLACAIREHGTGGPWSLFRAEVLALATSEVGWL